MPPVLYFLIFLIACAAAAATGTLFPTGAWYAGLKKPTWVPPNWLFPVAWTVLYVLLAAAGARVAGLPGAGVALALWALQIALNTLWTPVFFGQHNLRAGAIVLALLWAAATAAMIAHWRLDWVAGLCFAPYVAWLSFALALNVAVWRLNPDVVPLRLDRM